MEFFRKRPASSEEQDRDFLALEDGRREETQLIGQELVAAVAPRRVEVTRTKETLTYEQEAEPQVREEGAESQRVPEPEATSSGSMAMSRPLAVTPTKENVELDMHTPQVQSGAWPGGPVGMTPTVYGPPSAGSAPTGTSQPLFTYAQLKRLQDLYGFAPQLYGPQVSSVEPVHRPDFLEDEETVLRMRLKEIEEKKKKEDEASVKSEEARALKEMLAKTMQEKRAAKADLGYRQRGPYFT